MFKNVKNNIKICNNLSKTYETTRGTLQGDPISPILFVFFPNDLCKDIQDAKIGFKIDIENSIYIDDTAILEINIESLYKLGKIAENHSKKLLYCTH